MSTPRRGLGRGLGALLGDSAVPTSTSQEFVREISVAEITPNPFQPRKTFDPGALDELKSSIAEYGVLVPIIVRRRGEKYELVAGERRWRACAALGKATVPAIVRASDDRQTLEFAIVENLQRENLNPLEEAAGFAYLIEEHGLTQDEVARRLGKSRPVVANTLRLLALSDAIKAMLAGGALSAGHARALLTVPEDQRLALAQRAVSSGLTVRALEELAATAGPPRATRQKPAPASQELSPDEAAFVARLRERFGTAVELVRDRRGGRIELRFASDEELSRIGDLLLD
ncbi:MAG TPA: ParB/RepB/Spo0J family partition protein [Candidatus Baltobacteraceae bacterium]|jgi:ParB family chromosome partitioning protein|nr:ParB/RepB/Spo0J family partition protein [Candidatus Baltobacteraceae bacterium]